MRHGLYLVVIMLAALLLAACGGAPPTPTPEPPTAAPPVPTIEILEQRPDAGADAADGAATDVPREGDSAQQLPTSTLEGEAANAMSTLNAFVITPLPPPGTLAVFELATEEARGPFFFDTIVFTQSGGPANVRYRTEIHADGTVIKDGETSTVSDIDILEINNHLNQINFFNVQGVFTGPGRANDAYSYSLRVDLPSGSSRTLFAQDGMLPPELIDLFIAVTTIGEEEETEIPQASQ